MTRASFAEIVPKQREGVSALSGRCSVRQRCPGTSPPGRTQPVCAERKDPVLSRAHGGDERGAAAPGLSRRSPRPASPDGRAAARPLAKAAFASRSKRVFPCATPEDGGAGNGGLRESLRGAGEKKERIKKKKKKKKRKIISKKRRV